MIPFIFVLLLCLASCNEPDYVLTETTNSTPTTTTESEPTSTLPDYDDGEEWRGTIF